MQTSNGSKSEIPAKSAPLADAIATVDDSGKNWAFGLVNRHPDRAVFCTIKMTDRS